MTHFIYASPAKIKAAKSHICIIDRAGHEIPPYSCMRDSAISKVHLASGWIKYALGLGWQLNWFFFLCRPRQSSVSHAS